MMHVRPAARSWRPVIAGTIGGLAIGVSPFAFRLPFADQILFGLGLFLTYVTIGVLVALIPRVGPDWLFGAAMGALYSLPGSILVAVPYPLRPDAPEYYTNFAAGGMKEFITTFVYGLVVGLVCGLVIPRAQNNPRT
ncbi:MAG TPA: hypothetical protein VHI13_21685 [Candidatus Kapabacteria bacterium]|nr:hypothetical protein [Candidatus Kapabacteria bacterium]